MTGKPRRDIGEVIGLILLAAAIGLGLASMGVLGPAVTIVAGLALLWVVAGVARGVSNASELDWAIFAIVIYGAMVLGRLEDLRVELRATREAVERLGARRGDE